MGSEYSVGGKLDPATWATAYLFFRRTLDIAGTRRDSIGDEVSVKKQHSEFRRHSVHSLNVAWPPLTPGSWRKLLLLPRYIQLQAISVISSHPIHYPSSCLFIATNTRRSAGPGLHEALISTNFAFRFVRDPHASVSQPHHRHDYALAK